MEYQKEIDQLLNDYRWLEGNLVSLTLIDTPESCKIITLLPVLTEVESQMIHESVTIRVLKGCIVITHNGEEFLTMEGEEYEITEKSTFGFTSTIESHLLITIKR